MNQYLVGIYKGVFSNPQLNELTEFMSKVSNNTIRTILIENQTLLVAEEDSQLNAGDTDQYYLLTKELQKLNQYQEKFYFVYDYRKRKLVDKPLVKCFPLMETMIKVSKLQDLIQTVKNIKQDVFAGFKVIPQRSGLLNVQVLLTSPVLEMVHSGETIPESLRSDKHYSYLSELTELISHPALCISVQSKSIIC